MAWNSDEGRNRVALRLVRLIRLMQGRTQLPRVERIANELRVSERTVWRDLAALREAGWPVPAPATRWEEAA